jgi:hypothetical protein
MVLIYLDSRQKNQGKKREKDTLKPLKGFKLPTVNRHESVIRIASMAPFVDAYALFARAEKILFSGTADLPT